MTAAPAAGPVARATRRPPAGIVAAVLLVSVGLAGCAGTPAGSAGSDSSSTPRVVEESSSPAPSAGGVAAPPGVTLVRLADTADPAAAADRELALISEVRDDGGMVALLHARGADGDGVLATLDAIAAEFSQRTLRDATAFLETGAFPGATGIDPLAGHVATIDDRPYAPRPAAEAIDISLFADTGFTASALTGLFTSLVDRAADTNSGTLPRQDSLVQESGGLRQEVDLRTTMTVQTGGGRVSADITMSATDRIFRSSDGSFVALYTSTSSGHFDVSACPDGDGFADGTYTFETKHELNDVSATSAARSGAGRSVDAPFRLVNGDDAHLQRIEATLDLSADARGPGSPSGPGSTRAFDWHAGQRVGIVMDAGGGLTTATGDGATVTGTGGERAGGAMFLSSAMAQLFLGQVGAEAERFWRSGKCVDLVPSDDSRDVDPREEIDLTVDAKEAFGGGTIERPIVAIFTGTASLEPTGEPVDAPARFHFEAGSEPGERGTVDLEQTSQRGIGRRQVVYTVREERLQAGIVATARSDAGSSSYATEIRLEPIDLVPDGTGGFAGMGMATWTTTFRPGLPGCRPRDYDGAFETEVRARIDPADAERALVRVLLMVHEDTLQTEFLSCNGIMVPYLGGTFIGAWASLAVSDHAVAIGGSASVEIPIPGGTSRTTITVRRPSH